MRARRALLYTPGDDLHKIRKGTALNVDCLCLDLEDGVAPDRKAEARQVIVQALLELNFGRSERLVRLNAVGSGLEQADIEAILGSAKFGAGPLVRPDGLVLPKVESAAQVQWASKQLAQVEARYGWPAGGIVLIIQIESAAGLVNIQSIVTADPRLAAVIFGAEDFAADLGATRTRAGWEVFYARSAVVAHCAAAGLQAIDMVCVDYRDLAALEAEARQGAELGFAGKQVIHPAQVAPVQAAFTPTPEAVAHAERLLAAAEASLAAGKGAFGLDGKMVDLPVIKAAQRVLAAAGREWRKPGV